VTGGVRWLAIAGILVMACAAPARPSEGGAAPPAASPTTPKRIVAAIQSDPPLLSYWLAPAGAGVPGLDALESLVDQGVSIADDRGALHPVLADEVPTLENGLWKLLPDGRMETTWHIRENARWHDGAPFTSADLEFTSRVQREKALDLRYNPGYDSVDSIDVKDAWTIAVSWSQPYIFADALFNLAPLPQHLLEAPYAEDKAAFTALPYWTQEYVGTGPFKVRQFVAGSHVLLEANDRYVLGRPKIDELEVRFIPDSNTIGANVLAGEVQLTLGRSLSLEQAIQIRDQWTDGRMEIALSGWIVAFPQFINPSPAIIANLEFRRALLEAIDRQQMADTLMNGQVPVAHTFVNPNSELYPTIEPQIVKYEFDPRRATEAIQALGYRKGPDGVFRDAANQEVTLEIRASAGRDLNQKSILAIADSWQRLGIPTEPATIPQQRVRDREYIQTFPAFMLYNQPNDLNSLARHRSSQTPLPSNGFVGDNNSRYQSREFDALIDRFYSTIPQRERTTVLGQIVHHMTENLNMMGMFYNAETALIANRVLNASERKADDGTQTWNAHLWDVK